MRKKLVAANWKMNLDLLQAHQLASDIRINENSFTCDVILFPSFIFLEETKRVLDGSSTKIGAQNCSNKENGALTGEVSSAQLQSFGIEYVLIGHSERREHFMETDEIVKQKLQLAFKYGLKPIFCCGEPLSVRNEGAENKYVLQQLQESLFAFSATEISKLTIAYEPIWAIGTGRNASSAQAQQMHAFIREQIAKQYSENTANAMRILYGGSCKPENAKELFCCPDVDGALVGGASLKAVDFLAIINATQ